MLRGCSFLGSERACADLRRPSHGWPLSRRPNVSSGSRAAARGTHGSIARRWAKYGLSPAVRLIPCALLGNPRGISCAHGIALFILFSTQPTTADDTGGTTQSCGKCPEIYFLHGTRPPRPR